MAKYLEDPAKSEEEKTALRAHFQQSQATYATLKKQFGALNTEPQPPQAADAKPTDAPDAPKA